MKKVLTLCLLSFSMIIMSCQGTENNQDNKDMLTDSTANSAVSSNEEQVYVYRGVLPTKYDQMAVETMTLHMVEGTGEGQFVYKIDYGKDAVYKGQKIDAYLDSGAFISENSAEFGEIYVLKGASGIYNFQPMDNKLNELDSVKMEETHKVLIGIDPQDTIQTRKEILANFKGESD